MFMPMRLCVFFWKGGRGVGGVLRYFVFCTFSVCFLCSPENLCGMMRGGFGGSVV